MSEEKKLYIEYENSKQIFIESECVSEILSVTQYDCKIEDFPNTKEIWLAFYSYGITSPNYSFLWKIRYVFEVLKYLWKNNTVFSDQIILNVEQAKKLRDTLNEMLKQEGE